MQNTSSVTNNMRTGRMSDDAARHVYTLTRGNLESVDQGHGREQRQHWQSYFHLELEMASTHAEEQRE